jgi:hypothetical protein
VRTKKEEKRTPKAAGRFFFASVSLLVLSVLLISYLKATQSYSIKKHDSNSSRIPILNF